MIIKAKIDVTKIDKARLFQGKTGAKYLDITLLENRDGTDKYGNNFMIVQDVSKEERLAGKKGAILGNAKIFEPQSSTRQTPPAASGNGDGGDQDVPF